MIKEKTFLFVKKLSLFFALPLLALCVFSCENFEDAEKFFNSYGNIATITGVKFNREPIEKDGEYYIDSSEDFIITYIIDNPGNFSLSVNSSETSYGSSVEVSGNSIIRTITAEALKNFYDGSSSNAISTSLNLNARVPSELWLRAQDVYTGPNIKCNSPPPKINNALGQMQNDASSGINERLVIVMQFPQIGPGQYDWQSLEVVDKRTGTVHSFDYKELYAYHGNTDGSYVWTPNEVESNGWIATNGYFYYEPTYPNGPRFTWNTEEGSSCYILTDVYDISEVEPFKIGLFIKDSGGLTGEETEISSHVVALKTPTFNTDLSFVSNTLECPYYEFIIYAPSNASDATLHYAVEDSSGNPVADINGNASECVGNATFRLYPKTDGSSETYKITQAYATKAGYADSADAVSWPRSLSVSGVRLSTPIASVAPGSTVAQGTELVITSPDGGDIHWSHSVFGPPVPGEQPSPAKVELEAGGLNYFNFYAHKDYYIISLPNSISFNVTMSRAYVKSDGDDSIGWGTKEKPFKSLYTAFYRIKTYGSSDNPENTVYVLDDLTGVYVTSSSGYYNIVGCSGGVPGTPVQLQRGDGSSGQIINLSGGTLSLRAITISGLDNVYSGAVWVFDGTLALKDKVNITGNTHSGAARNIYLASGKTISVDADGLEGTRVGVTTSVTPSLGSPVAITSGYSASASASDSPALHFASDNANFAVGANSAGTEAVLTVGGGSISMGDIYSVGFAAAESAGAWTVSATAAPTSGSPVDITAAASSWSLKLYYMNTFTGFSSATNSIDLSAYPAGTYILKVSAVYGGATYSGEVEIIKN